MLHVLLPSIVMSVMGGILFALQSPINARLGNAMGGPLTGAFLSFLTGTVVLSAVLLLQRKPILVSNITQTPWWMWIGGTLGAFMVFAAAYSVERLGSAAMLALIIAGQIIASLVIDHYGILVHNPVPVSPIRIAGAVLLLAGVVLILYPKFR